MRAGVARRVAVVGLVGLTALCWASGALASSPTVFGPAYPLPGYDVPNSHGGSVCYQTGSVYAGGTLNWTLGADPATTAGTKDSNLECDQASAPTTAFDLTRFQTLYWGLDPANTSFAYCVAQSPTAGMAGCTGPVQSSGPMTYDAAASDPTHGTLVYEGTTTSSDLLTVHLPNMTAGTDATTIGNLAMGVSASQIGQVWQVPSAGANNPFTVSMTYSQGGSPLPTGNCTCRTSVSISAGFYYVDLPPSATISSSPSPPTNHTTTTFHVASTTDPYSADDSAAPPTYSWDLSGGTTYGQDANTDAMTSFGPGSHTVALLVTDADGISARVEDPFTITNQPPTGSISPSTAHPFYHQPVTFTATVGDPDRGNDGSCAAPTYAWDLTGGTNYTSDSNTNATTSFGSGTHTIAMLVTDCDGASTRVTYAITTVKPTASIKFARKQTLGTAARAGIKATFSANEASAAHLVMTVTKATSKTGKPITITGPVGSAKPSLTAAGSKAFTIVLSATAKQKLAAARSATFLIKGSAKDRFGNIVPIRASITLNG